MNRFKTLGITLSTILIVSQVGAQGYQPTCGPTDEGQERLTGTYGEHPRTIGLTGDGLFVSQMWGNSETGTWSFTLTGSDGITCLMLEGTMFYTLEEGQGDEPEGDDS